MSNFSRGFMTSTLPALSQSSATGIWPLSSLTNYISQYGGLVYIGTYRFLSPRQFNDANSKWVVPNGVSYLYAKCWGSGARGGNYPNSLPDGDGGAGGYSEAVIPVTAGEELYVGVGNAGNNGGGSRAYGGPGGGLSGIFRTTTASWGGLTWPYPLIIAGGGGAGQTNDSLDGGAGGGLTGQTSGSNLAGGSQTQGGPNATSINGSGAGGGGGGYYGGGGGQWYDAAAGGSGYVNDVNNLFGTTTTGNWRVPPNTTDTDYPSGTSIGGLAYGYGQLGNDDNSTLHGSGAVIIHTLGPGYDPSALPTLPATRTILNTY